MKKAVKKFLGQFKLYESGRQMVIRNKKDQVRRLGIQYLNKVLLKDLKEILRDLKFKFK